MKFLFFLFFTPFFLFSQTKMERKVIVDTYNQNSISILKDHARKYFVEQRQLIEEYIKTHPNIDNELHSLQRIENGLPIFYSTYNQGSSATIGTNTLYPGGSLGLNVNGSGMIAGVWDGGKVRDTHQEFPNGRIILSDAAATLSAHSTHVSGTICAAGTSITRRGIAYQAQVKSYDWTDDYNEMLAFGNEGYLVSNHSYGYVATGLATWKFGSYDASSIEIDNVANAFPFYQVVIAAGNDRATATITQVVNKGGYDMLTGTAVSKNGITVAAVDEVINYVDNFSVNMSTFSNYGPTDDGRIKPDISAKGVNTDSCTSIGNATYASYNGTSMATPAITGMILILQKHYNNLYNSYMKAATVRGLICHSAKEAGFAQGPDYGFGWGLADAKKAATIISNKLNSTVLEENSLLNGQTYSKQIAISTPQSITATICWTDPTGVANTSGVEDNRTPRLVNNLDLKILKDGVVYFPWKLNPEDMFADATRLSDNDVDNVEKVEIDNAQPGIYTIQVTHKGTLLGGSQNFSLIGNGGISLNLATSIFNLEDNIVLYPNPANELLHFSTPNDIMVTDVFVYDILGNEVKLNLRFSNNTIDVSCLAQGIYTIKFMFNNLPIIKKFIKQ